LIVEYSSAIVCSYLIGVCVGARHALPVLCVCMVGANNYLPVRVVGVNGIRLHVFGAPVCVSSIARIHYLCCEAPKYYGVLHTF
jgi:hypothetical protein